MSARMMWRTLSSGHPTARKLSMYFKYPSDSTCSQVNFLRVKTGLVSARLVRVAGSDLMSVTRAVAGTLVLGSLGATATKAFVGRLVLVGLGNVVERTAGWPWLDNNK